MTADIEKAFDFMKNDFLLSFKKIDLEVNLYCG